MGKPKGKRPVERTRRGWKYIKMNIKETRLQGVNWVNMTQDMDKQSDSCEHSNDLSGFTTFGEFLD